MRLTRSGGSVKLALATIVLSCLALLVHGGAATAAATTKAESSFAVSRSTEAAPTTRATSYQILILNRTRITFDRVNMLVSRRSTGGVQFFTQGPFTPNSILAFELANCTDIRQYAFHVILNGEIVARSGDVTPDDSDGDLCSDVWDIG